MHLVLTYFDRLKGPSIFMSFPDAKIEEDIINKLIKFFDLDINETFFEIVLINKQKKIINLYIEIPSDWARGKKEMVMLSLIMKKEYPSELVYAFIVETSHKILKTNNVFKAFYNNDDHYNENIEVFLAHEQIRIILFDCLSDLISRLESKIKKKIRRN